MWGFSYNKEERGGKETCVKCNQKIRKYHGKECYSCGKFYCSNHLPAKFQNGKDCSSCCKFYCSKHLPDTYQNGNHCSSCGRFYCSSHLQAHHLFTGSETGHGVVTFCCGEKQNGKYEGQFENGKENGCGVFTWPNGEKVMQRYKKGELVCEQMYSEEALASELVKQKMEEWETEFLQNWKEAENEIQAKQEKLKQEYNALEKLKLQFEEEKIAMTKFKDAQQNQVKLNVGGKIFETSVSTLTKHQSMLQSMFSGRYELKKDNNGAVFIDGDGEMFGVILNFLRRGILPSGFDKKALLAESEFYGLEVLVSVLKNE